MAHITYQDYEKLRLMYFGNREISEITNRSYNSLYDDGYITKFKAEHPQYRLNKTSKLKLAQSVAMQHDELTKLGHKRIEIARNLDMTVPTMDALLNIKYTDEMTNTNTNMEFVQRVINAERPDKFKLIAQLRNGLLKDFGGNLLNVPDTESRLITLQQANNALDEVGRQGLLF